MKIAVILNGISLRKKFFYSHILPLLSTSGTVEVFETKTRNDAITLAARAVRNFFDVIIAAGGDGTLNQTVNGVLRGNESNTKLPAIGLIPLGTGNDFAKTLKITPSATALKSRLDNFTPTPIDVGSIKFQKDGKSKITYFVNIADVGMGPEVVRIINNSDRTFGFSTKYYLAILKNFISYKPILVTIETDTEKSEKRIRTFAMANGKYFGHGLCIAPNALVDDARFETFTVGDVSVFDFIRYSSTLKRGKKINHPKVVYGNATNAYLQSSAPALIEADGELVGSLPVKIEILGKRLLFLK
jgi:YegS/Rv2252/BmrU family lipid kinase